jgi:hypothetical protein
MRRLRKAAVEVRAEIRVGLAGGKQMPADHDEGVGDGGYGPFAGGFAGSRRTSAPSGDTWR